MKNKYLYYCDDCKCFVEENHRCQQWSTVHMIPQGAIDKLLETAHNSDYAKCKELLQVINNAEKIQASTAVTLAVVRDKLEQHFA